MFNVYLDDKMSRCVEVWNCYTSSHLRILSSFCLLLFTFYSLCLPVFALEFDTSVDESIRKNYNPSKLEEDAALPALPKVLNKNNIQNANYSQIPQHQQYVNYSRPSQSYIFLRKGTRIRLKLLNSVSDRSAKGTKVNFVSLYPVSTTYYTIPMGTMFKGYILNSHAPQFTGNGGLIVININSIILNGETQPINAIVTETNSKWIFLNNIKGKRKYISSMINSTRPGYHFFKKMLSVTGRLANDGSSFVLTPFSIAAGVLGWGGNIFVSPALALFYKGSSVYLREGSEVEIRLLQDVFIYN